MRLRLGFSRWNSQTKINHVNTEEMKAKIKRMFRVFLGFNRIRKQRAFATWKTKQNFVAAFDDEVNQRATTITKHVRDRILEELDMKAFLSV